MQHKYAISWHYGIMQNMCSLSMVRSTLLLHVAGMDYWKCSPAVVQFLRRSFETLLIEDNKVNADKR